MNRSKQLILLSIFFLNSYIFFAQPNADFRSPMDVPLVVTAAFCELRANHFHAGIDLSTFGKEQALYACEEGFISRIRVSAYGYGLALYIDHPNGLRTVYGHMSKFSGAIDEYVKKRHAELKKFELDETLNSYQIPIKKGELIGYTGNTGASSAPHLHFEIREKEKDFNYNPLLYKFSINDVLKPKISGLLAFTLKEHGSVNDGFGMYRLGNVKANKKPKKKIESGPKVVSGWVAFGFEGFDAIGKNGSRSQPYDISLEIDGKLVYHAEFDGFAYDDTRWVNAFYYHPHFLKSKKKLHVCFTPPYNDLSIYKKIVNRGAYFFDDDKIHTIKVTVKDLSGNVVSKEEKVQSKPWKGKSKKHLITNSTFVPGETLKVNNGKWFLELGKTALFDTANVGLKPIPTTKYPQVQVHSHGYLWAINKDFRLKFIPSGTNHLKFGFYHLGKSKFILPKWSKDTAWTSIVDFGNYQWFEDTQAPVAKFAAYHAPSGKLSFSASDTHSGIGEFNLLVNNQWIFCSHDGKSKRFYAFLPKELRKKGTAYSFEVFDKVGNRTILTGKLLF